MKVSAYARVSAETDRMMHSLSAQISFYSDLIQKTPGWQYVGVYADNFISGTEIERRPEFKRLLQDSEDGTVKQGDEEVLYFNGYDNSRGYT